MNACMSTHRATPVCSDQAERRQPSADRSPTSPTRSPRAQPARATRKLAPPCHQGVGGRTRCSRKGSAATYGSGSCAVRPRTDRRRTFPATHPARRRTTTADHRPDSPSSTADRPDGSGDAPFLGRSSLVPIRVAQAPRVGARRRGGQPYTDTWPVISARAPRPTPVLELANAEFVHWYPLTLSAATVQPDLHAEP
jgi:hypothetical protein